MNDIAPRQTRTCSLVLLLCLCMPETQIVAQSRAEQAARQCAGAECDLAHEFDLLVSDSPARTDWSRLSDAVLSGDVYVFASQTSNQVRTEFWLDRQAGDDRPDQIENTAPWDFRGGQDQANAWDTTTVSDGPHSITLRVHFEDGGIETITRRFSVANDEPKLVFTPTVLSFSRDELSEQGSTRSVGIASNTAASVTARLSSNSPWLSASSPHTTTPAEQSISVDTSDLVPGVYRGEITAQTPELADARLEVTVNIPEPFAENQIHLGWTSDAARTMTISWWTQDFHTPSVVRFRTRGGNEWHSAYGASRTPIGADGALHDVELTALEPATSYEYQVQIDESRFSQVFEAKTASVSGPADFDAVFVADMALVGRLDGFDAGIDQVLAAISDISPDLILLGGDYVSFTSDRRFGTLGRTINAFFGQMSKVSTSAVMMPTFGNHEVFLGEGLQAWADRFAVPEGFDVGHSYSFDVADAHFLSIFAPGDDALSDDELSWIDRDLGAARDDGQRWLIAFQHVPLFSDGANHGSNTVLRAQLGPIFERHGVQLALSAHDQSFERTFPLVDVPQVNSPTSTARGCYELGDGVIYMKVSPGGKLSDITRGFSPFVTQPPPPWTAIRNDTGHHFSRLVFTEAGDLQVLTYSVADNRSAPEVVDDFVLTEAGCEQ